MTVSVTAFADQEAWERHVLVQPALLRASEQTRLGLFAVTLAGQLSWSHLESLLHESFPDEQGEVQRALFTLRGLSFLRHGAETVGLSPDLSETFNQVVRAEPEVFVPAARLLIEAERTRVALAHDEIEHWFGLAHLACFLSPVDAHESASVFAQAFDAAPHEGTTDYRLLLGDLVERNETFFEGADFRAVAFFRAFRAYVRSDRRQARELFDTVLRYEVRDAYRAVSLHLRSVVEGDSVGGRSDEWLKESIQLSEQLPLAVNEVMARNTRAYRLLSRAGAASSKTAKQSLLAEAEREALSAVRVADSHGQRSLLPFSRLTAAAVSWELVSTDMASRYGRVPIHLRHRARAIEQNLLEVVRLSETAGDLEGELLARNLLAQVEWQVGDEADALEVLKVAVRKLRAHEGLSMPAKRLGQTLGTLERSADAADSKILRGLALDIESRRPMRAGWAVMAL